MNKKIILEKANNSNGHKSCQGRQESDENRVADLMDKVLQIDSIRENIIEHVIENAVPKELGALRLVQKTWLRDVSKMLLKSRKPLYKLCLDEYNSLDFSDYVEEHQQKMLDHFISTVILSPSRIEKSPPPFHLSLKEEFFRDENHTSFANFLSGGSTAGLVSLDLIIPENGGSMDFLFPQKTLYLPILNELTIRFSEKESDVESSAVHGSNTHFVPFIQSILHGASGLERLDILMSTSLTDIPNGVQYLTLPDSLTTLCLMCKLTTRQLEGLAANSLPKLTHLTLNVDIIAFSNGILFRVLDQYKRSLQKLYFDGMAYEQENIPRDATYFSFPVMESLTVFASCSIYAELETHLSNLHTFLPKLEELELRDQTVGMFRKWTEGSCFPTVTQLSVGLVNENFCDDSENHYLTFRLEEMQLVHKAFPNVTLLELNLTDVTEEDTDGLKYLFMEMKQIKELKFFVRNSAQHSNSYYWDSLLIGVPLHVMETLGSKPELLEYLSVDIKDKDASPSIRNLTELRTLQLTAMYPPGRKQESLISDSVFTMALLKMPKLKSLLLMGRFMVSDEMIQFWESEQRTINYIRRLGGKASKYY